MKKLIERLLIFFIGLPAVVVIVMFDFHNHLLLNSVATILSGIGAVEFSSMIKKKNINIHALESMVLGMLAPLMLTLTISFYLPEWIIPAIVMTSALWVLFSGIFTRASEIENITLKVIGRFSLIVYPGLFMFWLIKMTIWGNNFAILLFLFMIFASDSTAWLFGSLFGKNNRGIAAVSPNKSIMGFIGGLLGPVIVAVLTAIFLPSAFPATDAQPSTMIFFAAVIGFVTGIAAILGDLSESAIKRSCDFKDSGNLMLGRGGVLDSIDSIAVAAPVFYLFFTYIFLLI